MEYLLLILTVLGVIIGILYLYSSQYDYDVYKYQMSSLQEEIQGERYKGFKRSLAY